MKKPRHRIVGVHVDLQLEVTVADVVQHFHGFVLQFYILITAAEEIGDEAVIKLVPVVFAVQGIVVGADFQ